MPATAVSTDVGSLIDQFYMWAPPSATVDFMYSAMTMMSMMMLMTLM
jgi:hypothetical protein